MLHPTKEQAFFNSYFKLVNNTMSSVSSIPYRICFCKQNSPKGHCLYVTSESIFTGQEFIISAASVGNHRGASPAVVLSQFCNSREMKGIAQCQLNEAQAKAELGRRQVVQKLGRTCGTLAGGEGGGELVRRPFNQSKRGRITVASFSERDPSYVI